MSFDFSLPDICIHGSKPVELVQFDRLTKFKLDLRCWSLDWKRYSGAAT